MQRADPMGLLFFIWDIARSVALFILQEMMQKSGRTGRRSRSMQGGVMGGIGLVNRVYFEENYNLCQKTTTYARIPILERFCGKIGPSKCFRRIGSGNQKK